MGNMRHADFYNSLLDVRNASALAETPAGRVTLDRLLSRIAEASMADRIAVRLLHKHNDLVDGERMREFLGYDEEGPALVTAAEAASEGNVRANSWMVKDGAVVPVEWSDAGLVQSPGNDDHLLGLFDRLAAELKTSGLDNVFGPALHYSNAIEQLKPTSTSALLEKTDRDGRANVLRFVERNSVDFHASVETKWSASRGIDTTGKPIWMASCTCFCSVSPNGGHLGTTTHRYEPDRSEPSKS